MASLPIVSCSVRAFNHAKSDRLRFAKPGEIFNVEEYTFPSIEDSNRFQSITGIEIIAKDRPVVILGIDKKNSKALVVAITSRMSDMGYSDPAYRFKMPEYGNVDKPEQDMYILFKPFILSLDKLKIEPFSESQSGCIASFDSGQNGRMFFEKIKEHLFEVYGINDGFNVSISDRLQSLENDNANLMDANNRLKEELDKLRNTTSTYTQQDVENMKKSLMKDLDELRSKNEDLQKLLNTARTESSNIQKAKSVSEAQLQSKINLLTKELNKGQDSLLEDCSKLEKQNTKLRENYSTLEIALREANSNLEEIKNEKTALLLEIENLKKAVAETTTPATDNSNSTVVRRTSIRYKPNSGDDTDSKKRMMSLEEAKEIFDLLDTYSVEELMEFKGWQRRTRIIRAYNRLKAEKYSDEVLRERFGEVK